MSLNKAMQGMDTQGIGTIVKYLYEKFILRDTLSIVTRSAILIWSDL